MSLINIRNLTAPIRSKVQLSAILIAALLVLVIRLSASGGAAITRQRVDPLGYSNTNDYAEDESARRSQLADLLSDDSPAAAVKPKPRGLIKSKDDVVESLVDGRFEKEQNQRRQMEDRNESFDDIRKSLGLE